MIAPVAEGAFGELLDVALVDQGQALALVLDRVLEGRADEALRAFLRDRLDADTRGVGEADFRVRLREGLLEHIEEFLVVLGAGLELDAGVDVFGVFAEDHHVHFLGVLHGGGHPLEPANRPEAHVQVKQLPQGHVQRADASADRRGERSLDRDEVVAAGRDGLVRQPGVEQLVRFLARVDLHPVDLALAAIGLLYRGVHDAHAGSPDVRAGAIAFDERNDGVVRDGELTVVDGDLRALGGRRDPWVQPWTLTILRMIHRLPRYAPPGCEMLAQRWGPCRGQRRSLCEARAAQWRSPPLWEPSRPMRVRRAVERGCQRQQIARGS